MPCLLEVEMRWLLCRRPVQRPLAGLRGCRRRAHWQEYPHRAACPAGTPAAAVASCTAGQCKPASLMVQQSPAAEARSVLDLGTAMLNTSARL